MRSILSLVCGVSELWAVFAEQHIFLFCSLSVHFSVPSNALLVKLPTEGFSRKSCWVCTLNFRVETAVSFCCSCQTSISQSTSHHNSIIHILSGNLQEDIHHLFQEVKGTRRTHTQLYFMGNLETLIILIAYLWTGRRSQCDTGKPCMRHTQRGGGVQSPHPSRCEARVSAQPSCH